MKNIFRLMVLIALTTTLFSFIKHSSKDDTEKDKFIGSWAGEKREKKQLSTWVQRRYADSTYTILFIVIEGKKVIRNAESGKWWIANGKFYELSPSAMNEPDVFDYKILDDNSIYFKSTKSDYNFIDKKLEENNFDEIKLD